MSRKRLYVYDVLHYDDGRYLEDTQAVREYVRRSPNLAVGERLTVGGSGISFLAPYTLREMRALDDDDDGVEYDDGS